jgi:CheY-like chemotaxis protein
MEKRRFWNVLIVDDEPDMHEVTELALKRETVFGAKLKIHHAHSAKEGREFFEQNTAAAALAVAFVDVVMESEDAGLQLCKWIRDERQENATQLLLRTGQPGRAPPRKIIDEYNISGYMTKMEATPERLYSALKTAIQEFYNMQYLFWSAETYDAITWNAKSPREVFAALDAAMGSEPPAELGIEFHRAMHFPSGQYLGQGAFRDRAEFDRLKSSLVDGNPQLAENGIAMSGNHIIVQAALVGRPERATMIVRDAICPRDLFQLYGAVWRQKLAYLTEVFNRM